MRLEDEHLVRAVIAYPAKKQSLGESGSQNQQQRANKNSGIQGPAWLGNIGLPMASQKQEPPKEPEKAQDHVFLITNVRVVLLYRNGDISKHGWEADLEEVHELQDLGNACVDLKTKSGHGSEIQCRSPEDARDCANRVGELLKNSLQ